MNKKLTMKQIEEIIELENRCGIDNLLQEIFSSNHAEKGIDIFENEKGYYVIKKGTTFKIKMEIINEQKIR